MKPFHKILVPVDFSPASERAFEAGLNLAHCLGAAIGLVHVYQQPVSGDPTGIMLPPPGAEQQAPRLLAELEIELDRACDQALEAGVILVEAQLLPGIPHEQIAKLALDRGYDLIVMGTHGKTDLQRVLLGSVADSVVRHAPCPVLTFRPLAKEAR